jgi:putative transposase
MDVASRRVLGFSLGEHHDAGNAYGALAMAVAARGGAVPGVVLHTDRGSRVHRRDLPAGLLAAFHRPVHGPSRVLDNAVIESSHSTLEFERRSLQHFPTRAQARAAVAAWIEDYNTRRRHSACQKLPPAAYEQLLAERGKEAA